MRGGFRADGRGRAPGNAADARDRAVVWVLDQGSLEAPSGSHGHQRWHADRRT